MAWISLGLQQRGKWFIILRDGQRVQITEESQQMPFSGVETKQNKKKMIASFEQNDETLLIHML